jgi:hypothetical protein
MKKNNTMSDSTIKNKLCIHSTGLLDNKFEIHEINDEDGVNPIAEICGELGEAEANAAFIVAACNNHNSLTEALENLYKRAKIYGAFADRNDANGKALANAKELLNKIKNESK